MSRLIGVIAIAIGAAIIVVSPSALDSVFLTLPSGSEIHVYDLIGAAVIVVGLILSVRRYRPPRAQ